MLKATDLVKLVLPDNEYLDGQLAVVAAVTDYGACVITKVGSGSFRALFAEMVKLADINSDGTRKVKRIVPETMNATDMGYTGDLCETCGCMMMRRDGKCLRCDNCGTGSGCS